MTHLLDGNVLVALVVDDHVHYRVAQQWFGSGREFATSPTTQGTLVRFLVRRGVPATDALTVLNDVVRRDEHEFWPDDIAYPDVNVRRVIGHRQVTDAYLAALARARGGRVATFDRGLAAVHEDVATVLSDS
jgi:toxin-antitoxin system PIN domain toxin